MMNGPSWMGCYVTLREAARGQGQVFGQPDCLGTMCEVIDRAFARSETVPERELHYPPGI